LQFRSVDGLSIDREDSMSRLSNKVAVVTGASKGIGAEIARELAAAGAAVVVNYATSRDGAEKIVAEIIRNGGKAAAIQGDVAKAADVERLFAETKRAFGPIGVLVNNAGIYQFTPIETISEEVFHRHFNTNVLGVLLATKAALKHFGPDGGSVINIGSVVSRAAPPESAIYVATKGAVEGITCAGQGTRPPKDPSEFDQSRHRRNRRHPRRRDHRQRFRAAGGAADTAWPVGATGRYRPGSGVFGFRRISLGDRRNPFRDRRIVSPVSAGL
jgi:hypothetical protein